MLLKWINYCRGTVRLRVTGPYPERFLNLCMSRGIVLWNLERRGVDTLYVTTHVSGFRAMRSLTRKCHCRIHILSRGGLPFALYAARSRPVLWLGMAAFVWALYMTGSRVWAIEITGECALTPYELRESLANQGVYIGARAGDIEPRQVKNAMLQQSDELSFVAVNVRGNRVQVEVRQRVAKPEIEQTDTPVSIVADKTGVLESLDVKQGQAVKKVGQTVLEGETVVSALMQSEREGVQPRLVHAAADIKLRTWYTYQRVFPTALAQKSYTGRERSRYALVIGKKRINLFLNSGNYYDNCDKITKDMSIRLSESFVLPVRLIRERMCEYEKEPSALERQRAEEILTEHAREDLQNSIGEGSIVSFDTSVQWDGDTAVLSVRAECLEQTGVEREEVSPPEEYLSDEREKEG